MSEAPPCHKLIFLLVGRLLAFLASLRQVSGLLKPSFLQFGQILGIFLSVVVPLVALSVFHPNLLVSFVTSVMRLDFVATNPSLFIFSAAIAAISCSSTNSSVVSSTTRFLK